MRKRTDQKLLADILRNAESVSTACFVQCEAVDLADDVLELVKRMFHKRRCHDCGNLAWHKGCFGDDVKCSKCSSMDTRLVKVKS